MSFLKKQFQPLVHQRFFCNAHGRPALSVLNQNPAYTGADPFGVQIAKVTEPAGNQPIVQGEELERKASSSSGLFHSSRVSETAAW
jgi:hypothetical protein